MFYCAHINYGSLSAYARERVTFDTLKEAESYFRVNCRAMDVDGDQRDRDPGDRAAMSLYVSYGCKCDHAENWHDWPDRRYTLSNRGAVVREIV